MSSGQFRRRVRGNPRLLRQLRGERVSVVDQPASAAERAFAAAAVLGMLLTSLWLTLT